MFLQHWNMVYAYEPIDSDIWECTIYDTPQICGLCGHRLSRDIFRL